MLSLKEHHARTLLIHYQWDVDKVFAIFVERGKERVFVEAGITLEEKNENPSSDPSTEYTCEICFEDFPDEQTTLMECNHRFCNDCEHLLSFILIKFLLVHESFHSYLRMI